MRLLILYFSGTGNTHYIGKYMMEKLSPEMEVQMTPVEAMAKILFETFDAMVFGFPVYAGGCPPFLEEKLKKIRIKEPIVSFTYCTRAIFSGDALRVTGGLLRDAGFVPRGTLEIKMPVTDGLAFMGKESKTVKKIEGLDFTKMPEVDAFIEDIRFKLSEKKQADSGLSSSPMKVLIGKTMGALYGGFENSLRTKFHADENCILCGKCERVCPMHNIKVDDRVHFGDSCVLCMRCIHQCPKEAVQIGKHTAGKFRWDGPDGSFKPIEKTVRNY